MNSITKYPEMIIQRAFCIFTPLHTVPHLRRIALNLQENYDEVYLQIYFVILRLEWSLAHNLGTLCLQFFSHVLSAFLASVLLISINYYYIITI